jgi:trimethylamine--corrinoid protein Co-methyltransferase
MLASYQAPELDPAIDEALKDYIQSRKNSLPDSEY